MNCKAKTKTGAPCRAAAGPEGLCFLHAHPERVKTLAQAGGRANRKAPLLDFPLPDNPTAADLLALNAHATRLLLSGDLRAREAGALAQLCNSMLRVMGTAKIEIRIAALETQIAELQIAHQKDESANLSDASDHQPAESASDGGDEEAISDPDESHGV